jgi:hypothetical protein
MNDHVYVVKLIDKEKVVNISKLKKYTANKYSPPLTETADDSTSTAVRKPNKVTVSNETGVQLTLNTGSQNVSHQTELTNHPANDNSPTEVSLPSSPPAQATDDSLNSTNSTSHTEPDSQVGPVERSSSESHERPRRIKKPTQPLQVDPHKKSYNQID